MDGTDVSCVFKMKNDNNYKINNKDPDNFEYKKPDNSKETNKSIEELIRHNLEDIPEKSIEEALGDSNISGNESPDTLNEDGT